MKVRSLRSKYDKHRPYSQAYQQRRLSRRLGTTKSIVLAFLYQSNRVFLAKPSTTRPTKSNKPKINPSAHQTINDGRIDVRQPIFQVCRSILLPLLGVQQATTQVSPCLQSPARLISPRLPHNKKLWQTLTCERGGRRVEVCTLSSM